MSASGAPTLRASDAGALSASDDSAMSASSTSARDDIMASIRASLPEPPRELPVVPMFDDMPHPALEEWFKDSLEKMGGEWLDRPASGDSLAPVHAMIAGAKVVVSMAPEMPGTRPIGSPTDPHSLADVDYAVVRCAFAVAETGSVCFTEAELGTNALGYLPQHLIVLLDPRDIVLNIHHAYRRPELKRAHYATFHTGPSATADIEGVLIHGAQGVRSLSVLLHPRGAAPASG
ncbi:MAG TPA: LUD domain-containing protein [Acetobacteraceae bacterium]